MTSPKFLLLLLLLLAARLAPAQAPRYALPTPEAPVALLPAGAHPCLVTRQGVWERRGRHLLPRYRSPLPLTAAVPAANPAELWLGTTQGLRRLNLRTGQAQPLAAAPAAPVTALLRDAAGHLWVGLAGHGAYELAGDSLVARLRIPGISAGLATADGAVWLGTNLGLHRYQSGQWTRYNEEGVANHEIPDNLVEKLLPDGAGRVWVVMSEAVCLLDAAPATPGHDELPTARFVGQPGNTVHSVAYAPGQGWVLATDLGLLLLPGSQPQAEPAGFAPAPATDEIAPQRLLRLLPTGPGPRPTLVQRDAHGHLWLASEAGLTVWPTRTLRQLAATSATSAAGASALR